MIDVTVKTLDSQNHRYSVVDDITVKQFKERIATSVNIPADKQRLIYCGRVLQDEKNLSEYNVHEKVIHLVMRAPPQPSNRGGDRRDSGTSSSSTGGGSTHFRHRGSIGGNTSGGRQVLFGPIVVSEDGLGIDDLTTTTQGPSSSGVRLQQAKTMLDKASEVLRLLENAAGSGQTSSANGSAGKQPSSSNSSKPPKFGEPMETSTSKSGTTKEGAAATAAPSTSTASPSKSASSSQPAQARDRRPAELPQADELDALFQEMDALNNMDPPIVEGAQLIGSGMGNPIMGAISNSLQGGIFQAASAAFVSALSSIGATPVAPSSTTSTATPPSSTPATTETASTRPPPLSQGGATTTASTSSTSSQSASPGNASQPRDGPQTASGNPLSGVRGITVRITNRGTQRAPAEHPRPSVMVDVLDQYQEVQRRLEPFLQQYYRSMVEDRPYESDNDRHLHRDQMVIWRVSSVLHYTSHALHAISDIMIDLRRNPPRQLRARPFIIPQPALVQAQINVAPSSGAMHHHHIHPRSRTQRSEETAESSPSATTAPRTQTSTRPSTASSSTPTTASSNDSNPAQSFAGMSEFMDDDSGGVVFMHVGPNGITVDSLSADGPVNDSNQNPPPEFIQNIMSSLTSQLGMRLATSTTPSSTATASDSSVSASSSAAGGASRAAPGHNSQAAGNSGTNTTNATQTRVTPRAHVTPIHVPGMGMTQFDPFLPCQSHHIRPTAARRRQRHPGQVFTQNMPSTSQERGEASATETTPSASRSSDTSAGERAGGSQASNNSALFANLLSELQSESNSEPLSDVMSEVNQEQEQMFAEMIQDVMTEFSLTLGAGDGSSGGGARDATPQTTVQDFLQPYCGEADGIFSEGERDSFFARLVIVVSRSLSMTDLFQIFFGDSSGLMRLQQPLQSFIRERVLRGAAPTAASMDTAIDEIIGDINPHLLAAAETAEVKAGIDYVNSVHMFIRQKFHVLFNIILRNNEERDFGSTLFIFLRDMIVEFLALSLHCFVDGAQGVERVVQSRVQSLISFMSPSFQTWSMNTSITRLRSMMSQMTVSDESIRDYVVSPEEGLRMDEARLNRIAATQPGDSTPRASATVAPTLPQEEQAQVNGGENLVEVMEVDELGGTEEVRTTAEVERAVGNEETPLSVTVGSQSWHSAVPQDWIPVITRDVERQRRGVPDTNLSDGYLCGVPLKRRKITNQEKPHGSVQHVLQDTLRQSLRTSGVNRNLVENVSGEVSSDLGTSFATHVRCALRDELEDNKDFKPEKFPKSEQRIRKK